MPPKLDKPLVKVALEPQDVWYVTLFHSPKDAGIYGPFDTERDAQDWLDAQGGPGHVWRNLGVD